MNGLEMVQSLVQRGYTAPQAAALAGHFLQESGGNPAAVNPSEDAHGLMQWRGSRWQGLQDFAKSQGKDPTDPQVQLDYVGKEMSGPEAKSSAGFRSATDVASASAALKPVIRFGDDSAGKRLDQSMNLYNQYTGSPPVGALAQVGPDGLPLIGQPTPTPVDPTNPANPTQSVGAPSAPTPLAAPPPQVGALAAIGQAGNALKGIGATPGQPTGQPQQPEFLAPQQIAMGQQNGQSQMLAAALAKQYGIGT